MHIRLIFPLVSQRHYVQDSESISIITKIWMISVSVAELKVKDIRESRNTYVNMLRTRKFSITTSTNTSTDLRFPPTLTNLPSPGYLISLLSRHCPFKSGCEKGMIPPSAICSFRYNIACYIYWDKFSHRYEWELNWSAASRFLDSNDTGTLRTWIPFPWNLTWKKSIALYG